MNPSRSRLIGFSSPTCRDTPRTRLLCSVGYLMPAPEQRVVNCPCGTRLLLRWTWSIGSAIYPVRCPDSGAEHQLHAIPPIGVYRLDSQLGIPYNDRQRADITAGESKRPSGKKV